MEVPSFLEVKKYLFCIFYIKIIFQFNPSFPKLYNRIPSRKKNIDNVSKMIAYLIFFALNFILKNLDKTKSANRTKRALQKNAKSNNIGITNIKHMAA